jgi:lysophospholipase L1-like esterase
MQLRFFAFLLASCLTGSACAQSAPNAPTSAFGIRNGDRVVFYGDSITEQREYTEDVEEFVLTRFPAWKVSFDNAGVGGDTVSGGWAGPIDLRLRRDLFSHNPDIVTIMLGMNDSHYRADEPGIFSTYADGYRHIVAAIQQALPAARITLIQPSPYDDVTSAPLFPGGLNGVLIKYSNFVADLSRERGTQLADFNTPVVAFLNVLNQQAPDLASQLIPGRVHPQQSGHWLMAESLLKTWHATPLVSAVSIDAGTKTPTAEAQNAALTALRRMKDRRLAWTQLDGALPLPLPPAEVDPVLALTVKLSDLIPTLDQETLHVQGLAPGKYELRIDDRAIGTYTEQNLSDGINLATLDTPMLEQSRLVAYDTERKNTIEAARFELISRDLAGESSKTAAALEAAIPAAADRQRTDAQPRSHRFEIVPMDVASRP